MADLFDNPMGLDGFEFVEFSAPDKTVLESAFRLLGFTEVAKHRSKDVALWRQGDINFIINNERGSQAWYFAREHGPCACGMAFRVRDAHLAYNRALEHGAQPVEIPTGPMELRLPAIKGIGGATVYLIDRYEDGSSMTAPDGKIRIPLNEEASRGTGQIEEYLMAFNGEGIQHIAFACDDLYACWDELKANGIEFMTPPPGAYYEMLEERLPGHGEPVEELQARGILLDGTTEGGEPRLLLQIFSANMIGPTFFEFIQRKEDEGFGEGNFKALFESIERDQVARGIVKASA